MTLHNHLYQQELRERVLQKIIDDWDTYFYRHGEAFVNLSAIRSKNGFVEDVTEVVEKALAEQLGMAEAHKITPSKDTLRRLFFEYDPTTRWQTKTRLALCLYVGFASWDEFKDNAREQLKKEPVTFTINQVMVRPGWLPIRQVAQLLPYATDPTAPPKPPFPWRAGLAGLLLLTVLLGLGRWARNWWQNRPFSAGQLAEVKFHVIRVEGKTLPQTLAFSYDISSLGVDSVVVAFDSADKEYNHKPGDLDKMVFHQPKGRFIYPFWKPTYCIIQLVARNQVVAQLRHTTRTDGWIGWTADPEKGSTQALPQSQIQADGRLKVPLSARKGEPGDFYSHVHNQRPFGLDADEMDWQVRLKDSFAEGGISCFDPAIGIRWGNTNRQCLAMQTSRLGCGVSTSIQFGDQLLRNGEHDLSRLSTDFETWRTLRIITKNRLALFFIDGKEVFRHPYTDDLPSVEALQISFKGSGSVDWMSLANSRTGQVVYEEEF